MNLPFACSVMELLHGEVLLGHFHVGGAHEDFALHAHQGAHGGGGHTVLSGARLGNDARLAHLACQEDLPDGVVDFVRSGVVEVFALEVEATAVALAQTSGEVEGRGSSGVVAEQGAEFRLELFRVDDVAVRGA